MILYIPHKHCLERLLAVGQYPMLKIAGTKFDKLTNNRDEGLCKFSKDFKEASKITLDRPLLTYGIVGVMYRPGNISGYVTSEFWNQQCT